MIYSLKEKFFDNIILLLLVLSTGGLLFVFNRNLASVSFLFVLIGVVVFFGSTLKRTILNSSLMTIGVIIVLGVINYYFAIVEQTSNKYLFYLLTTFLSILTLLHFKNNRTSDVFLNRLYIVLKLIAFHAFINFMLFFFIRNNLTVVTSTYHECETLFNLFFYTPERGIIDVFGLEFCRNQGLFWEPGVLQAFLNILFFLEAFVIKKSKGLLLFIAFLILTTYSTTGIALLLIQMLVFMKSESKSNKFLIPIVVVLIIPIYLVFSMNIDSKIQGERESSFQKRIFDLTQPIFIALEYPLTGIGLDLFQFQKIRQEFYISSGSLQTVNSLFGIDAKVEVTDKGSSNSIMFLLAGTGFPTTILLLYMFFNQQIIKDRKWLWMTIMVISVMSEPLLLRPFFFLFIISGFTHIFYKITLHKNQLA